MEPRRIRANEPNSQNKGSKTERCTLSSPMNTIPAPLHPISSPLREPPVWDIPAPKQNHADKPHLISSKTKQTHLRPLSLIIKLRHRDILSEPYPQFLPAPSFHVPGMNAYSIPYILQRRFISSRAIFLNLLVTPLCTYSPITTYPFPARNSVPPRHHTSHTHTPTFPMCFPALPTIDPTFPISSSSPRTPPKAEHSRSSGPLGEFPARHYDTRRP